MTDETVLITGASSGIGLELARRFAADGAALVLVARSEEKLGNIVRELRARYGVAARVLAYDLSDPAARPALFEALRADGTAVDVLVNNAGFGARGSVAALGVERQLGMVQLNVAALTHLTRLFLPGMIERGQGGVLNVASTAAFQPGPQMAVYYATKAFVLSFTEGVAEEVRPAGVRVCCLAPGPTDTGFRKEAGLEGSRLFTLAAVMTPEAVARAGYEGFRKGRVLVVPGAQNKLGAFLVRFVPRALARKVAQFLQA